MVTGPIWQILNSHPALREHVLVLFYAIRQMNENRYQQDFIVSNFIHMNFCN